MSDIEKHVESLVAKGAAVADSGEAMRFTQAALNACHAAMGMADMKRQQEIHLRVSHPKQTV